jgi:hypothetical protein
MIILRVRYSGGLAVGEGVGDRSVKDREPTTLTVAE